MLHFLLNVSVTPLLAEELNELCAALLTEFVTPLLAEELNKGKVFYGQEPPSGESTTTECGFNYQLLAVIY